MTLKGEAEFDIQKVINLEKENQNLNQTIGAQKEALKVVEKQLAAQAIEADNRIARVQKEVIIRKGDYDGRNKTCPNCGYLNSIHRTICNECGATLPHTLNRVEYKNLDEIVDVVRKEESKKVKVDILALENSASTLEFDLQRKKQELKKVKRETETEVTDAKSRMRSRYNKMISSLEKQIEELSEELKKVKEERTDTELEARRDEQIADLETTIGVLKEQNTVLKSLNPFKRWNYLRKLDPIRLEAEKQVADRRERISDVRYNKAWTSVKTWLKRNNLLSWTELEKVNNSDYDNKYPSVSSITAYNPW